MFCSPLWPQPHSRPWRPVCRRSPRRTGQRGTGKSWAGSCDVSGPGVLDSVCIQTRDSPAHFPASCQRQERRQLGTRKPAGPSTTPVDEAGGRHCSCGPGPLQARAPVGGDMPLPTGNLCTVLALPLAPAPSGLRVAFQSTRQWSPSSVPAPGP